MDDGVVAVPLVVADNPFFREVVDNLFDVVIDEPVRCVAGQKRGIAVEITRAPVTVSPTGAQDRDVVRRQSRVAVAEHTAIDSTIAVEVGKIEDRTASHQSFRGDPIDGAAAANAVPWRIHMGSEVSEHLERRRLDTVRVEGMRFGVEKVSRDVYRPSFSRMALSGLSSRRQDPSPDVGRYRGAAKSGKAASQQHAEAAIIDRPERSVGRMAIYLHWRRGCSIRGIIRSRPIADFWGRLLLFALDTGEAAAGSRWGCPPCRRPVRR